MDKISVIIPVYKVEEYIDECVNSVIYQTYKNLEIILVDDGSPDKCGEICEEYAKKDSRIKVIHKPNGGLSDARNKALDIATGKYVMFLDSDDFYELNACEIMYKEIEEKQADYVVANYINTDNDGVKWDKPVFDKERYKNFKLSITDYQQSFYIMNSAVWNKIFRRDFIEKLNLRFVYGLPAEDAMFTTYCFIKSSNVYYINDVICNYRQRSNNSSISNNCSIHYFRGISEAYKIIYDNFKENDCLGFYRYFYAKSLTYMLYKFIDSTILTKEEKTEIFTFMRWFYQLSVELKVPTCQRSLGYIVDAIIRQNYEQAIIYCDIIAEIRVYLPNPIKESMSKPDSNLYKEIAKFDDKY